MGRLIDASNLNFEGQHYNKSQMKAILDFVDAQPTAYDVEKVVDAVRVDCYSMGFDESQTEIIVGDIRKGGAV